VLRFRFAGPKATGSAITEFASKEGSVLVPHPTGFVCRHRSITISFYSLFMFHRTRRMKTYPQYRRLQRNSGPGLGHSVDIK